MKNIGFSTGAIALGDFERALRILSSAHTHTRAVELSALRISEVRPLIAAIPHLDLSSYSYISFHAPSKYDSGEEEDLVQLLHQLPSSWPIVIHPDAICNFSLWAQFKSQIAIENMDRRKPIGRTVEELTTVFQKLPLASMCFDIGHARQLDASMTEAYLLLKTFRDRIVQIHVSEVDTSNRHDRISFAAEIAFRQVSKWLPADAPLIVESRVREDQLLAEIERTLQIFSQRDDLELMSQPHS